MTLIFVYKVAGDDLETFTSTISVEESENSRSYSYKSKIKPLEIENRAVRARNEIFEKFNLSKRRGSSFGNFLLLAKTPANQYSRSYIPFCDFLRNVRANGR